jgi:hypothetical protein
MSRVTYLGGARTQHVSEQNEQRCARCGAPTWEGICGNRLLLRPDVSRLPLDQAPLFSWRCASHQGYQMRDASAVQASELGDVIYTLTCGHEVHWVFRGRWAYTSAQLKRSILTRQIRLDQPQRCYLCGDQEEKRKSKADIQQDSKEAGETAPTESVGNE